jgi:nucleotide-binding universal stress UspA family protein
MVRVEILLATDGSQRAKKAQRAAFRLSKAYNLHMAALFVVNFMNAHSASEREKTIKQGEKVLNEVAAEGKKLGVEVEKILEIGHTGNTILKVSRTLKVHTIVMGSESRNVLRFLSGSITGKVLKNAECTVIVAR